MSLDTEGSEYEILQNFDFEKYTFGLIDVEHNYIEPRRTEIKKLLLSKGYIYRVKIIGMICINTTLFELIN